MACLPSKTKLCSKPSGFYLNHPARKCSCLAAYGYRSGKGAVAAIRKVKSLCNNHYNRYLLRLDIDDYFNHINHDKLEKRVRGISQDPELIRLIMLCIKMVAVTKKMSWKESEEGVHQESVLSPCLANLYLHSFDVFVVSQNRNYVRYADDFVIFCQTREEAERLLSQTEKFLKEKLDLSLNPPVISVVKDGFEFLGITLGNGALQLSPSKKESILNDIATFHLAPGGLSRQAAKNGKEF